GGGHTGERIEVRKLNGFAGCREVVGIEAVGQDEQRLSVRTQDGCVSAVGITVPVWPQAAGQELKGRTGCRRGRQVLSGRQELAAMACGANGRRRVLISIRLASLAFICP